MENSKQEKLTAPHLHSYVLREKRVREALNIQKKQMISGQEINSLVSDDDLMFLNKLRQQILLYRKINSEPELDFSIIQENELARKTKVLCLGVYGTSRPKYISIEENSAKILSKSLRFESRLNRIAAAKLLL